ncbi:MAG: PHP domain-containing protein, partial [Arenicella sp.]|nr:PHP domain-containing protein [Arenicella sp.]
HCHSYYSDGELAPEALLDLAEKRGITHLALTDHDTTAGLAALADAGVTSPVSVINGIELSCSWRGQLLHVLGLNIDPGNEALISGIKQNIERRFERAEAMHEDFEKHGINLRARVDRLLKTHSVPTRPHFAQALVDSGVVKDKRQAFKRYLVRGKPGFVAMRWPEIDEIASWILEAGGIAVLAHPLRYKFTRSKLVRLIDEMKLQGVEGMEVSTAVSNSQQTAQLTSLANQHRLLASIGSDFHALDQPWAALGNAAPLSDTLTPVWSRF